MDFSVTNIVTCISVNPVFLLQSLKNQWLTDNFQMPAAEEIIWEQDVRMATHYVPPLSSPSRRRNVAVFSHAEYVSTLTSAYALRPRWVKRSGDLDLLTLKVVCAMSVSILVFLGLSVFYLGPMYATGRQTSDKGIA